MLQGFLEIVGFIRRGRRCACGGRLKEIEGWHRRECMECGIRYLIY